jgi:glycosyltransferase involved in cell wall biosynthesis
MKIALITHHFPPNFNAGAEQYVYRVAKMLVKMGHQIEVVCIESISEGNLVPICKSSPYNGIQVHRLFFNLSLSPNPYEIRYRNPYLGEWVKGYLEHFRPNVVHFNSGYLLGGTVIEAAHELGIPSVLTLHEGWFLCSVHNLIRADGKLCEKPCPPARCVWSHLAEKRKFRLPDKILQGRLGMLFEQLSRWDTFSRVSGAKPLIQMIEERRAYLKSVLQKVDIIISPSQFLIQKFTDFGMNSKTITYLPFGLDTTNLTPSKFRPTSEILNLGYLGQFADYKGVHILLQAFNRLDQSKRKCMLVLHGTLTNKTPYGARILKEIQGNDQIINSGRYDNARVGEILNQLDLIIVPSVCYENRPTIIVEALAMKTPVVASKIGGIGELIADEQNGLLFEAGNVAELTQKLQRFLDDPALQQKLRAGIQPVIQLEEEMEKLVGYYSSLLLPCRK